MQTGDAELGRMCRRHHATDSQHASRDALFAARRDIDVEEPSDENTEQVWEWESKMLNKVNFLIFFKDI